MKNAKEQLADLNECSRELEIGTDLAFECVNIVLIQAGLELLVDEDVEGDVESS